MGDRQVDETQKSSFVVVFNTDGMGHAPAELRSRLANIYLQMLLDSQQLPDAICFYGGGVKLALDDSPVLEMLHELSARGVYLILCSTCLNYFGLREQVRVGVVGGMHDILEAQLRADKVITL